jgi:hypothetical protein
MIDSDFRLVALILWALIALKFIIFGQYWPWQFKHRCPYCKREWEKKEPQ